VSQAPDDMETDELVERTFIRNEKGVVVRSIERKLTLSQFVAQEQWRQTEKKLAKVARQRIDGLRRRSLKPGATVTFFVPQVLLDAGLADVFQRELDRDLRERAEVWEALGWPLAAVHLRPEEEARALEQELEEQAQVAELAEVRSTS